MNKEKERHIREKFIGDYAGELTDKELYEAVIYLGGSFEMENGDRVTYQDIQNFIENHYQEESIYEQGKREVHTAAICS
jgi:hypothetical protein